MIPNITHVRKEVKDGKENENYHFSFTLPVCINFHLIIIILPIHKVVVELSAEYKFLTN
jgi:hypothetical protein